MDVVDIRLVYGLLAFQLGFSGVWIYLFFSKSVLRDNLVSLPVIWLLTTTLYLTLQAFGVFNWLKGVLGLFVPIGYWNFTFSIHGTDYSLGEDFMLPWILAFPLVLVIIFGGEYLLRKKQVRGIKRFFAVFLILLICTALVDFIIWGKWQSIPYMLEMLSYGNLLS
jgi:hypothetical protein